MRALYCVSAPLIPTSMACVQRTTSRDRKTAGRCSKRASHPASILEFVRMMRTLSSRSVLWATTSQAISPLTYCPSIMLHFSSSTAPPPASVALHALPHAPIGLTSAIQRYLSRKTMRMQIYAELRCKHCRASIRFKWSTSSTLGISDHRKRDSKTSSCSL